MEHAARRAKGRRLAMGALVALSGAAAFAAPRSAQAQITVACDFDIDDNRGIFNVGNTLRLIGRAGAGTTRGTFFLSNGNSPDSDVDRDGYGPTCTFANLFVDVRSNLINVANPALAIPGENIIITNFPRRLDPGENGEVSVFVDLPPGTVAGTYQGRIVVRDNAIFSVTSPSGDVLNLDRVLVEVVVLPETDFTIVDPDAPIELDSVTVAGRAGTRANGVFRIANSGNTSVNDVRLSATELRSESAVGLVIPAENVQFSPPDFASIALGDTVRVTVQVRIPRGILGGRYRGSIIVQSQAGANGTGGGGSGGDSDPNGSNTRQEIPLIVIVSSTRGILFANNPVRATLGDIAQIAFNGDPGTQYQVGIFEMTGLMVYQTSGQVFSGIGGTSTTPGVGADFAVNLSWPLINGRGEQIASGMYLVVVESFVNGKRQVARDRLMVIR